MDAYGATGDLNPHQRKALDSGDAHPDGVPEPPDRAPRRPLPVIGRFRTLRVLGEGGMGVVYLAEQDNPRRQVALKVIRPGMASPALLRRFEFEALVLARLHHPGIAQIYDAGTADTGAGPQPYFAMELVQGVPLTDYARARRLGTRERLALFAKVCEAVQHAHAKGVIHRDLKPGNILVTDDAQPKILDFGVARATDADVQMTTLHTDIGALVGTLPYMSPEQVAGQTDALDVRSDVYALGVVLYELLAERPPYRLDDRKIFEAARAIQEEEPTRLSVVSRVFRGDVETIVAKALEKDRARRYQTASALADDIRRYLIDEPIQARPPSAMYQVAKFARRHKAIVGGVAVAFVALAAALAGVSVAWARAVEAGKREAFERRQAETARKQTENALAEATTQRDAAEAAMHEAEIRRRIALAVNTFVNEDLLASVDPEQMGIDVRMRDVLDTASRRLDQVSATGGPLDDQPEVRGELHRTLGLTYKGLGERDAAERHLRRAVDLRTQTRGPRSPESIQVRGELAIALVDQDRLEEAEAINGEALADADAALDADDPIRLTLLHDRSAMLITSGRNEEAQRVLDEVIERRTRTLGPESDDTLQSRVNLAFLLMNQGRYDQAEAIFREVYEAFKRTLGPEHPDTLVAANNLATLYDTRARSAEAEPILREIVEVRTRILGADHPHTWLSRSNLAYNLALQERHDEAEAIYRDILALRRARYGPTHRETLTSINNLGTLLDDTGRFDEAEPLLLELVDARRATLGPEHPDTVLAINNLAVAYLRQQRYDQAIAMLREARDINLRTLGEADPGTINITNNLAFTLLRADRAEEAEALFRSAVEAATHALPPDHWFLGVLRGSHGAALLACGRLEEAEATLLPAYDASAAALGPEHNRVQTVAAHLMRLYRRMDEALPGQGYAEEAARWQQLAGPQGED
ncbi:MAG: serine/threonine-protein kinase [Phycisphaerales bacterium]